MATDRKPRHIAPADLEGALIEMGIFITRSTDDEVTAHCPGHLERVGKEDRNPTWSVNRTTGLHNCYSCGYKGTFIKLVMDQLFPSDVFRAARWLRQFGTNLARASELTFSLEELKESYAEVEQTLVPETQLAMFADVPDWALEARHISREAVEHYGVRWDSASSAWIIPVRMPDGELAGWQKKWQKKRRFINDPPDMKKSLCLFGLDVFPVGEPAILLESPLDVLRLHTAGYEGGLAAYGAAVSFVQIKLIEAITDEVVVALDDDRDGRLYAEELRVGKWEKGVLVQRGFAKGNHVRFFAYGKNDPKDIGDMDNDGITRGLYEAQHSSVARLGSERQKRQRVHRRPQGLPAGTRRADGRPGPVPGDGRRRRRQDPDDHRGPRGTA